MYFDIIFNRPAVPVHFGVTISDTLNHSISWSLLYNAKAVVPYTLV